MQYPHPEVVQAVKNLGGGPLDESSLIEHIHPLFSRVLARNEQTDEIYLANHSLGRPLDLVATEVVSALDAWYSELDDAWDLWIDARDHYRRAIAQVLRWPQWDAVVPKTSAGQGLRAVLNAMPRPEPGRSLNIVSTRCEFDSIDFILKSYAHKGLAKMRWVEPNEHDLIDTNDLLGAIDESTDLVVVSMVYFVTGQFIENLKQVIEHAHRLGAMVVIDAYHAFGALPIDFADLSPDFIIGGNYKYTRGGAGACFLAIHPRHLHSTGRTPAPDSFFPIDTGWFAKDEPFAYKRQEEPIFAAGGNAWLEATPPALTYFQALPGLVLTNLLGVDRLREYSLNQQEFLVQALQAQGITTRLLEHRGAFILIEHDDGPLAIKQLKDAGVNADARPLIVKKNWAVRLCPDLLNTRAELEEAARRISQVLGTGIRRAEPKLG